jgi:hypothetical protein
LARAGVIIKNIKTAADTNTDKPFFIFLSPFLNFLIWMRLGLENHDFHGCVRHDFTQPFKMSGSFVQVKTERLLTASHPDSPRKRKRKRRGLYEQAPSMSRQMNMKNLVKIETPLD